jgi:flagellar biosynthesis protein FlhF
MKVKRYFASNMRSALDMIKLEQGPDVLILSNRKVDGGIELVTADELSEQEVARLTEPTSGTRLPPALAVDEPQAATPAAATPVRAASATYDAQAENYLWTDAGTVTQMREELRSLKSLLETQLSSFAWTDFGGRHPLRARLLRALSRIGITPALARNIVDEVPDELDYQAGWHRVIALLVLRLSVLDDPILRDGGRVALLGPTGVGKSTLVSKLAARYALANGPDAVVIVSLDDRRLGAHQQMKAFGRLIGSPVYTLRDCDELAALFEAMGERRLVLIDTPGNAPDDARYRELVMGLDGLQQRIQMYNVISATTDYLAAAKMLRVTADLALDACILTKMDEAATLGPSLSAIIESRLPLAYTSAGQSVPADLDVVEARKLLQLTVKLAQNTPQSGDPMLLEQAFTA